MASDFCVIGGGIVGLATAMTILQQRPGASLVLLEKEDQLAMHQTGHNSGVIHSGIYYPPGSFKAQLCRRGADRTRRFADEHSIPYEDCGKLLVATDAPEVARLDALYERARDNNVDVERIDATELRRREPNLAGRAALYVANTGIIDFALIARTMAGRIESLGGQVRQSTEVTRIRESAGGVEVITSHGPVMADRLVVCGGLQADRLARLAGLAIDFQIVPFRGEYYRLPSSRAGLVRHLIYPVPDPELPFLGVHLTRTADGGVTVGPNAVLGLSREGYRKFSFAARDVREYATFPGTWRMARANMRTGARELRNSLFRRGYLRECRRYVPDLTLADLLPQPAGIRAQAVRRDGTLVHDFLFAESDRMLHVCNAPSPAATSAIPIAELIAAKVLAR
jgi:(S)-2-hydroxyglutarate dehydrogenase